MAKQPKSLVVEMPPALLADVESVSQRGKRFLKAGLLAYSVIAFAEWGSNFFDHKQDWVPQDDAVFTARSRGTGVSAEYLPGGLQVGQAVDMYGGPVLLSGMASDSGGTCFSGATTVSQGTSCTVSVTPQVAPNVAQTVTTSGTVAVTSRQRVPGRQDAALSEADGFVFEIPAGSMFQGKVIRSAEMVQQRDYADPESEIMVAVDMSYLLPDEARKTVNQCFAVLHGNLSASDWRAQLQANDLSCSTRSGRSFHAHLPISVIDSSGHRGITGEVRQKPGELIANSLLQGMQSGANQAHRSTATVDQSAGCGNQWQSVQSKSVEPNTAPGGELSRLAEFYMAQNKTLFPVVEIPAGTPLNFVIPQTSKVELMVNAGGEGAGCASGITPATTVETPAVATPIKANWWLRGIIAGSGLTGSILMTIGGFLLHRGRRLQDLAGAFQAPQIVRRRKRSDEQAGLVDAAEAVEVFGTVVAGLPSLESKEVVKRTKRSKRCKSRISFEVRW